MSKYIDIDGLSTFLANIREEYSLGSIMGSSAIGSTSAYPYWTGSSWATQSLSDYALKSDIPTIPSLSGYATEQWVLDRGYLTSASLDALETAVDNNATDIGDHENRIATIEDNYAQKSAIPTSLSDLANDVGYITSSAIPTSYAWSAITGKPDFAAVATSGSYNDLSNKPSIPSIAGLASESWVSNNFLGLGGGTIAGNLNIGYNRLYIGDGSGNFYIGWGASNMYIYNNYYGHYFATNGAEQMRITQSGNVGIGTDSPAYRLDVNGPIAGHEIYSFAGWMTLLGTENVSYSTYLDNKNQYGLKIHYGNGVAGAFFSQDGNTYFYGNVTTSGDITSLKSGNGGVLIGRGGNDIHGLGGDGSLGNLHINIANAGNVTLAAGGGNVGIGTTSPECALDVVGDIGATGTVVANNFYGRIDNADRVGPTEQLLVLQSEGSGMIARCPGIGFHLSGYAYSTIKMRSDGSFGFYNNQLTGYVDVQCNNITASGTIYSAVGLYTPGYLSARSTTGSSDRNLKTNIAPVRNALAYILGTNYVSFDWKDTGEHSVGIIAQDELNREWSCLVQKYNEHYSYQYTQHTALIGSALQEEDKKVEALKTEMATLKTEMATLKTEMVTLKAEVQQLRNERQLWQQ